MLHNTLRGQSFSTGRLSGLVRLVKSLAPNILMALVLLNITTGWILTSDPLAEASTSDARISPDLQAAQSATFKPSDDSFTHEGNPGSNFGNNAAIRADSSPAKIIWLKFSVGNLPAPVARARLQLYANNAGPKGGDLFLVSNNGWSERRITWNNQPPIDGPSLGTMDSVSAGSWYEWDVTSAVAGNGTYSFALTSSSADGVGYNSSEAGSKPPKLVIDYAGSGSTPTPVRTSTAAPQPTATSPIATATSPAPTPTADPGSGATVRFAVIGDFGRAGQGELDVANRVKSWNPDFIITTGDNNYPDGEASTIDANIGQYYHSFISPYKGSFGPGADTNRFFPSLGNHDWHQAGAAPYIDYFSLPGNERYYDFTWGPVHFFAIDSDSGEPDGNTSTSTQAQWLQNRLAASTSCWDIVYLHHAPYSSGSNHGSTAVMQWPYQNWGADAVMAGHDHLYERILRNGFPYFVNGLGGKNEYGFGTPISGSVVRYNADLGAMLVTAQPGSITYQFITRTGTVVDNYTVTKTCP